jgi:hypothetical protein
MIHDLFTNHYFFCSAGVFARAAYLVLPVDLGPAGFDALHVPCRLSSFA